MRQSRYPPSLQRAGRMKMSRCLWGLGRFGRAGGRLLELGAVGKAVGHDDVLVEVVGAGCAVISDFVDHLADGQDGGRGVGLHLGGGGRRGHARTFVCKQRGRRQRDGVRNLDQPAGKHAAGRRISTTESERFPLFTETIDGENRVPVSSFLPESPD